MATSLLILDQEILVFYFINSLLTGLFKLYVRKDSDWNLQVSSLPVSRIRVLAKPDSSSRAANEILRSVFQDEISRWHTKYVARTKSACAESAKKFDVHV